MALANPSLNSLSGPTDLTSLSIRAPANNAPANPSCPVCNGETVWRTDSFVCRAGLSSYPLEPADRQACGAPTEQGAAVLAQMALQRGSELARTDHRVRSMPSKVAPTPAEGFVAAFPPLTNTETRVFQALSSPAPGRWRMHPETIQRVWGDIYCDESIMAASMHLLRVNIWRLRHRLIGTGWQIDCHAGKQGNPGMYRLVRVSAEDRSSS